MFKFTNLHSDLENVKFDAVSQALASSQTLVSSFRTIVVGLIAKLINNDALIKGRTNGPDLASYNIDDSINQLQRIKDQYSQDMDVLYRNKSIAFQLASDQALLKPIVAGMSPCSGLMDVGYIRYNHPWWVSKFNVTIDSCPVDFILNLIAYPKMKFYPTMSNTQIPSLSSMYNTNSNLDSSTINIYQDFWAMRTLPHDNRPIWISILPLIQSSRQQGAQSPGTSFMTLSDYSFEISGSYWYTNAYLIQQFEYVKTGSSYSLIHSCGIVVTASRLNHDAVETKAWFKSTTNSTGTFATGSPEGWIFNRTWRDLSLLNSLEFSAMDDTPMMDYNRVFDCFTTTNISVIAKYLEAWRSKGSGDEYNYIDYLQHVGNTITGNDNLISGPSVDPIPITTSMIEEDGKVIFSDLKADIPNITGNVLSAMDSVISDLTNYSYDQ